jgi:hypothetical protein
MKLAEPEPVGIDGKRPPEQDQDDEQGSDETFSSQEIPEVEARIKILFLSCAERKVFCPESTIFILSFIPLSIAEP